MEYKTETVPAGLTTGGGSPVDQSADQGAGQLLRCWGSLFRRIPNLRGKGKLLLEWPSLRVRKWPPEVTISAIDRSRFFHCDLNLWIYRQLYFWGYLELDVEWMCNQLLLPGDIFVDVGACFGYYAVTCASRVGQTGRVYAIEPQAEMFTKLVENVARNALSNVEAECLAISNRRETIELCRLADCGPDNTSISSQGHPVSEVLTVPASTLDEYVEQKRIGRVTLVKADVEGSEMRVVEGAVRLLSRPDPPMWIFEINEKTAKAAGFHPRDFLFLLAAKGYEFYRVVWGRVIRITDRIVPCSLDEIDYSQWQNLLCVVPAVHHDRLLRIGVD